MSRETLEKNRGGGKTIVDGGDWKRGGRLRGNVQNQGKKELIDNDDGSEETSMRVDEGSLSPPPRRQSRSPTRIISGRVQLRSESTQCGEKKGEPVLPWKAPLHEKPKIQGMSSIPWRLDDVQTAINNKEKQSENHMHGYVHGNNDEVHGCSRENMELTPQHDEVSELISKPTSPSRMMKNKSVDEVVIVDPASPANGAHTLPSVSTTAAFHPSRVHNNTKSSQGGNGPNHLSGANPYLPPSGAPNLAAQNAWRTRKGFRFSETEPLKNILDEDGITINLDMDESGDCLTRLEGALVAKIIGKPLPLPFLNRELKRRWAQFGNFKISPTGRDSFMCIFGSKEARDAVLCGGPWFVGGQLIGMDSWNPKFNPSSFKGITSPIWIRLPELPLQYWSPKNIGRIATKVGVPLWIDDYTLNWERLEFARVCVKVDFSQSLPNGVWLHGFDDKFFQPIVYEGISQLCFKCGHVGHNASSCSSESNAKSAAPPGPSSGASNDEVSKENPKISLTKSPRGSDCMNPSTSTQPPSMPPNYEAHNPAPPPPRPSTSREGNTKLSASLEPKRPPLPASPSMDDFGYGPWTLVTYKKKKQGLQRNPPLLRKDSPPKPDGLLQRPKMNVGVTTKPLIFSATTSGAKNKDDHSNKLKSNIWRPRTAPSRATPAIASAAMEVESLQLEDNRKRKKSNMTIEFGGGDASPVVN